jgi:anti-anti-sigma factor
MDDDAPDTRSSSDHLALHLVHRGGELVVELVGEIDVATASMVETALGDALTADTTEHLSAIRIDLSRVTFLDSTGLSALVTAKNLAAKADVSMTVVDPSRVARRVLELTGLSARFRVEGGPDD